MRWPGWLSGLTTWWRSMGYWRWLNALPIVVALFLSTGYEAMPEGWIDQGQRRLGELEVRLQTRGAVRAGESLPVRVSLSGPGRVRIGFASRELRQLTVEDADDADNGRQVTTRLTVPSALNETVRIVMIHGTDEAEWRIGRLLL